MTSLNEGDILLDAAGPDPAFASYLSAPKPSGHAPVHRSDVEVVAIAYDPYRNPFSQSAVASERRDL
jgi:hypothetical protein